MRHALAALAALTALAAAPALAQTTVTGSPAAADAKTSQDSGGQQAVTRPNTDKMDANGTGSVGKVTLEKGANSFLESEAKSRLDKAGFKDAQNLKKDPDGIWRGTATHDGKQVQVGLDYKGNAAVQ